MHPRVVLIGQANVGKSSLFNRLGEQRRALTSKTPGTTRDRNYIDCDWQGKKFTLIDLAGFEKKITLPKSLPQQKIYDLEKEIKKQIDLAIKEADLILFLIDLDRGLNQLDIEMAKLLKKNKKPIVLALNKTDSPKQMEQKYQSEYWRLGLGEPYPISAITGLGIGDLLDEVVKKLNFKNDATTEAVPSSIKVAIMGRPNVGKSSLVNSLLGEDRVIVSSLPHTTREPADTLFVWQGQSFLLIDTAGVRKKSKIKEEVERVGVIKSLSAVRRADVVVLVMDLTEKIGHQDKALLDLVVESGRSLVLAINKVDLEKNFSEKFEKFIGYYQNNLPGASWAPIIFISAKNKKNLSELMDLIKLVKENRQRQIDRQELSVFIKEVAKKRKFTDSFWPKVQFSQLANDPPLFLLSITALAAKRKLLHPAQLDIIEKELRKKWSFEGVPIKINLGTI